jgi:hypothetical protein
MRNATIDIPIEARVRAEYQEMPGMSLTLPQAARLFNLDLTDCARVLDALVTDGALWTNGREFLGRHAGRRLA